MARNQPAWVNWSQYVVARVAAMGLTMFEAEANLRTAAVLGRQMYRHDHRHRQRAASHIARAFPDWTEQQVGDLVARSFEHFVKLLVEVLHLPRVINPDSWPAHVRLRDLGPALRILNSGKPAILVTGHVGNWEVLGYLLALLGYRMHAIARPLDNPLIYQWLLGIRQRRGLRVIDKFDATDRMLDVLAHGESLGFIADQNAGNKGVFVPFFGRLASTYKSVGLLAINQRVPIVCGYAHRLSDGFQFEVGATDVILPGEWDAQPDPLYYVTARYMRAIELQVRRQPAQYLWMHRRWKSRPRYEQRGKPMPQGLRKQLTQLPWMDNRKLTEIDDKFAASDGYIR